MILIGICFWICFSLSRQLWRFNIDVLELSIEVRIPINTRFPPVAFVFLQRWFSKQKLYQIPTSQSKIWDPFCRSKTEDIPMLIEVSGSGENFMDIGGKHHLFDETYFVWKSTFQRWDDFCTNVVVKFDQIRYFYSKVEDVMCDWSVWFNLLLII